MTEVCPSECGFGSRLFGWLKTAPWREPAALSAVAGEVEFTLVNSGAVEHDLRIEEAGDTEVAFAAPGETATGSIELEAGTYTYHCSVPGHLHHNGRHPRGESTEMHLSLIHI